MPIVRGGGPGLVQGGSCAHLSGEERDSCRVWWGVEVVGWAALVVQQSVGVGSLAKLICTCGHRRRARTPGS